MADDDADARFHARVEELQADFFKSVRESDDEIKVEDGKMSVENLLAAVLGRHLTLEVHFEELADRVRTLEAQVEDDEGSVNA